MEVPLQITLREMARSEALSERIRADAEKLERLHPEISNFRVVVQEDDRRHRQGRSFSVHLEVRVPGRDELVSTHQSDGDVYVAVRDAFEAVRRQFG